MNYDSLMYDLSLIIDSDFNIHSLQEIKKIFILLNRVYREELGKTKNKILCKNTFEKYSNLANNMIFSKLKDELGFSDEVIMSIIDSIKLFDKIEDIYVINEKVIVKYNKDNNMALTIAPRLDFIEITSDKFLSGCIMNRLSNLAIVSINNAIKPFVQDEFEPSDVIENNNYKINYLIDDLNVFTSHNLSNILSDRTGSQITNVIAFYNGQLLCFDMKIRGDYVILINNDYHIQIISEIFNQNSKTMK